MKRAPIDDRIRLIQRLARELEAHRPTDPEQLPAWYAAIERELTKQLAERGTKR